MSDANGKNNLTGMLRRAREGEKAALDELFPIVYQELRRVAARQLLNERANHTLQPTALVHEAYLRLINQHSVDWQNRTHFFSIAAEMMRRILVNHALEKRALKRGSGKTLLSLEEINNVVENSTVDLIFLDKTLDLLAAFDRQQAKIVELRFFGGLTTEETAHILGISESTVNREWRSAKAWIKAQLS